MSDDDADDKRRTESFEESQTVHSGGMEVFAAPEEDITVVVRMMPAAPDSDGPCLVDMTVRSDALGGRFLMEPGRAEELGEKITAAATAARELEENSE